MADGVARPGPAEVKGFGFFGDTPAEAKGLTRWNLRECLEQH
jgi:hypothetical protein